GDSQVAPPVHLTVGADNPAPAVDLDHRDRDGAGHPTAAAANGHERVRAHRDPQGEEAATDGAEDLDEHGEPDRRPRLGGHGTTYRSAVVSMRVVRYRFDARDVNSDPAGRARSRTGAPRGAGGPRGPRHVRVHDGGGRATRRGEQGDRLPPLDV